MTAAGLVSGVGGRGSWSSRWAASSYHVNTVPAPGRSWLARVDTALLRWQRCRPTGVGVPCRRAQVASHPRGRAADLRRSSSCLGHVAGAAAGPVGALSSVCSASCRAPRSTFSRRARGRRVAARNRPRRPGRLGCSCRARSPPASVGGGGCSPYGVMPSRPSPLDRAEDDFTSSGQSSRPRYAESASSRSVDVEHGASFGLAGVDVVLDAAGRARSRSRAEVVAEDRRSAVEHPQMVVVEPVSVRSEMVTGQDDQDAGLSGVIRARGPCARRLQRFRWGRPGRPAMTSALRICGRGVTLALMMARCDLSIGLTRAKGP